MFNNFIREQNPESKTVIASCKQKPDAQYLCYYVTKKEQQKVRTEFKDNNQWLNKQNR